MNNDSNCNTGGCLCGQVSFEVYGAIDAFMLCHCKHCQKDTGSAHAANLFSNEATLKWLSGQENIKTFNLPGTRHTRSFCMQCGSAMPYIYSDKMVVLPAGSLDTALDIKPTAHIFCQSQALWEKHLPDTIKYDELPQDK